MSVFYQMHSKHEWRQTLLLWYLDISRILWRHVLATIGVFNRFYKLFWSPPSPLGPQTGQTCNVQQKNYDEFFHLLFLVSLHRKAPLHYSIPVWHLVEDYFSSVSSNPQSIEVFIYLNGILMGFLDCPTTAKLFLMYFRCILSRKPLFSAFTI